VLPKLETELQVSEENYYRKLSIQGCEYDLKAHRLAYTLQISGLGLRLRFCEKSLFI
jgi:hypothetical protein